MDATCSRNPSHRLGVAGERRGIGAGDPTGLEDEGAATSSSMCCAVVESPEPVGIGYSVGVGAERVGRGGAGGEE